MKLLIMAGVFLMSVSPALSVNFAKNEDYSSQKPEAKPQKERSPATVKKRAGYEHYGTTTDWGKVDDASKKLEAGKYRGSKSTVTE